MNPQERISTILLIEQLKHSKANICHYLSYKDIVSRKEVRYNGFKKNKK